MDALALGADEGRSKQRKASVSRKQTYPEIPEWGNPSRVMSGYRRPNTLGRMEASEGTETSKYLEEKKSNEIPSVVASESGGCLNE